MATRRIGRVRRTDAEISLDELGFFKTWELIHGRRTVLDCFETSAAMAAVWEANEDQILDRWRAENPSGTRPFCWWLFVGVPTHGERLTTKHWTTEHEANRQNWTSHGILHVNTWPPMQEPEYVFLYRHGLIDYTEHEEAAACWRERCQAFGSLLTSGGFDASDI